MKYFILSLFSILVLFGCTPMKKQESETKSPVIRVLLNEISSKDSIFFKGAFQLQSEEANYEFGEKNKKIYIVPAEKGILLYNENRYLEYQNSTTIILRSSSEESYFVYGNNEFHGNLIIRKNPQKLSTSIFLINSLSLEEYLLGVVPAEIPVSRIENYEAVKAQAICARTYSLKKIKENQDKDFDIYSDVRDQVYKGNSSNHSNSDRAIYETRGVVLTFNGNPAQIFYHSTCGGKLESVENVFNGGAKSYLASGVDAVSDIFSCSSSPKFRWIEIRTIEQLDSSFNYLYNKSQLPENELQKDTIQLQMDLNILNRTQTGRVRQMEINYADTTVLLHDFEIRRFLGWPLGKTLFSNLFYISQTSDSIVTMNGGGYGHGVGMCQWGALNMSAKGFRYYHILNKYFPGTILSKGY